MTRQRLSCVMAAGVVLAIMGVSFLVGCRRAEHPENAGKSGGLTKDQLADAIEGHIQMEAAAHDGAFPISDERSGQQLHLTPVKVHRDKLTKVGQDRYFACVDFKAPDGKLFDVDFFMDGPDKEELTFSKFTIHKEDGKERYTWHEEGGVWKQKPVEAVEEPKEEPPKQSQKQPAEQPKEHPSEHPK